MGEAGAYRRLLHMAIEHQDGRTSSVPAHEIEEDKKAFLSKVMKGLFKDAAVRFRELIDQLDNVHALEQEQAASLWDEIQDSVEGLDEALLFCQLGGLPVVFQHIRPDATEAQALPALSTLSTLGQNNTRVQDEILQHEPIPVFAELARRPDASEKLTAKALGAISSCIRGKPQAEEMFLGDYNEVLEMALKKPSSRVKQKTLFLLQALIGADYADVARGEDILELLPLVATCLEDEDRLVRYHAAQVVAELSNLIGAEKITAGPAGPQLRRIMTQRREALRQHPPADVAEAMEEQVFWNTLEARGRFLRDGEERRRSEQACRAVDHPSEGTPPSHVAAEQSQSNGQHGPVLMIAPERLRGASQAP